MLSFFMTPIACDIAWLQGLLLVLAGMLFMAGVLCAIVLSRKGTLSLFKYIMLDVRGSVIDIMILLAGSVTNYVANNTRLACAWLSLAAISAVCLLKPFRKAI